MQVLQDGLPVTDITPGSADPHTPGFALVPAPAAAPRASLPGPWLQFMQDGVAAGDAAIAVVDLVGDPERLVATRGVGENSHVITMRVIQPPDPFLEDTILLFHYDDPDDLTNIFDSSPFERGRPNYLNGTVPLTTAKALFGTTSCLLGGQLQYRHDADMDVSNSDFTIETFILMEALPTSVARYIVIKSLSTGVHPFAIFVNTNGTITATGWNAAGSSAVYSITSASVLALDEWTHVALTRNGATFTLWINGVSMGTATYAGALYSNTTHPLCFGSSSTGSNKITAYFAETRMTKAARYTAPFAVPTARFTDTPMPLDIIWEAATAPSSQRWAAVAFGDVDGGVFAAGGVDQATGLPCAMYSLDRGATWAVSPTTFPSTGGAGFSANNLAFGAGLFVAPVTFMQMFVSSDGISWSLAPTPPAYSATCIYFDNDTFITFDTNTNKLYTSQDGLVWTERTLPSSTTWACGAGNGAGVHVVAAGDRSTAVSVDNGVTWSAGGLLPFGVSANYMACANGVWVVTALASTQTISYSTDNGATWQLSNTFYLNSAQIYQRVRYVQHELRNGTPDNAFVVLDVSGSHIHRSFDGITWFGMTPTSTVQPNYGKDWDTDGEGVFVSVGNSGTPTTVIARGTFQP